VVLTATVLNTSGQGVGGVDCTFSIASEPGGPGGDAQVGSKVKTVKTGADGRAVDTLLTGSTPGVIVIHVTAGGLESNVLVTVTAGGASAPLPPAAPLNILPPNTGDGGLLGTR
jgi:hypothetical protein